MKNKKIISLFLLILIFLVFTTCENGIVRRWWQEDEGLPFIRQIFPQTLYEIVVEKEYIYEQIFVELPPEVIYETIVNEVTIIEEVIKEIETVVEVEVPVYIYEIITETVIETITVEMPVIVKVIKEVYIEVAGPPLPPSIETIIEYIKGEDQELIIDKIIEVIKTLPKDEVEELIKEIIKELPPQEIIKYLTDEQIKYIIQTQPPELILQTLEVVQIEFILFAGDSLVYNGEPREGYVYPGGTLKLPPVGTTPLTLEEKNTNNNTIINVANFLKNPPDNSNYMLILHGHANPVDMSNTNEIDDLKYISEERAKEVFKEFKSSTRGNLPDSFDEKITVSGYGGESTIASSTYQGLNRRVEVIVIKIKTTRG